MRKTVFCVALALVAVSCQKVTEGGNKGSIKMEEGVVHYSDDEHRTVLKPVVDTAKSGDNTAITVNGTDSTKTEVKTAPAPTNGVETTVNTTSAPVNNAKTDAK